ncbi:mitochondrial import receptor subunit TOM22 homolog [Penaeus japonicus]|uniref:mitochondrial import receptor subunit TOM22 homolog n=1 Tax=Penaeus japonicus TaxID=27405 RepID=UPI001C71070B|nr:mitochondrial import receptor subunit TOM22 homolog [Penaeus japonicus]
MATLTELVDLDSGVASSEATPESQTTAEETAKAVGKVVEAAAAQVSSAEEEDDKKKKVVATLPLDDEDDDEEDEDFDESFAERVWGLTEMFPERLRTGSANAVSSSVSLVKGAYDLSRQVVWIAVSTSILLFAPVMFEIERLNVEEMMKQDRNRLVLGPGSAMSGGPPAAPGLMPPPPTR